MTLCDRCGRRSAEHYSSDDALASLTDAYRAVCSGCLVDLRDLSSILAGGADVTRFSTFAGRRKPLNPFSEKRAARLDARDECVRAVRERARGRCEGLALWPHECRGPLDTHEVVTRGRGGDETDPDNCLLLCRRAHDFAHAHPDEGQALGLLRHSWERP